MVAVNRRVAADAQKAAVNRAADRRADKVISRCCSLIIKKEELYRRSDFITLLLFEGKFQSNNRILILLS
jgi:hypothetical protein